MLNSALLTSYATLGSQLEVAEKEKDDALARCVFRPGQNRQVLFSVATQQAKHAEDLNRLRDQLDEVRKRSESEKEGLRAQLDSVSKINEELSAEYVLLKRCKHSNFK